MIDDLDLVAIRARAEAAETRLAETTRNRDDLAHKLAEARAQVERVRALADEWDDWPLVAEGDRAADLIRDLRAALDDEPEVGVFGDPEIHALLTRAALDPADTTNERGE